jgi:nucleotide-binding universal stress UspA family protein
MDSGQSDRALLTLRHNNGTFVSMLNALYVTCNERTELARRVTVALRATRLRKISAQTAIAGRSPNYTPDLIVTELESGKGIVAIRNLRKAYPKSLIVVAARKLSGEASVQVYRAGATTVVPVSALGPAISNLTGVLQTGSSRKIPLDETMVEEFHDPATGRLDANAVARGIGISTTGLAKSIDLTPSALSKRPDAKAAQEGLRQIEFAVAALRRMLGSDARVRAWLNAPHPDLGGEAPLALLKEGSVKDLADYVRAALSGQPT